MPRYYVTYIYNATFEVEADNEEQAEEIADGMMPALNEPTICDTLEYSGVEVQEVE